ncbi:hypothetical protein KYK30_12320 [Shinella yambaruensis]|uniref:Uncharacterized protein n=1 Tax=Shinella yambaruensis TaxID=415996 RepID=A0ABQ5ZDH6_9HYPH|nr:MULTISPECIES: hypothetical protein [Shinella]CAI0335744.1 conserved hypothetical protein [Rhizobiaceae bacterium]CAK7260047.1 Protoheme IX farnesyltransferase [Shinella sp. WSC3-e]MCJ8024582.1 hypothetical protein [Shinella yambaruensis]MCO5138126.1 hypothetical protein [Shinella sp.]MCU7980483.1 hypothetical protein [Shinella yambaruensis]
MSNAKLEGRPGYLPFGIANDRRARRARQQALVNQIVITGAFLFVGAVVFGLVG